MEQLENRQIAAIFEQMGDLMEIKGGNGFRIRAFRRIAQAVENLPESAQAMLSSGLLAEVPGIGSGALERIEEILETGTCNDLEKLRSELPEGLLSMLHISGLGPKKVKLFYDELGIASVDDLEAAARAGDIAELPRMGAKSQDKLLKAIEAYRRRTGRIPLTEALPQAEAILDALRAEPAVLRAELAGSTRRRRDTIGDLDVLVSAHEVAAVMDRFVAIDGVSEVIARGETKCSVKLDSGLQVDLRVLEPESYGAAMHYFTGSQMHNIAIRDRAKRSGLRISEYGVFREPSDERIGGATEQEIFDSVGLPYIPPELRENRGEIEAAEQQRLPELIERAQLRGDMRVCPQLSSDEPIGEQLRLLADAAVSAGYERLVLAPPAAPSGLNDAGEVERFVAAVRQLEQEIGQIELYAGLSLPIDADGGLGLDGDALQELDWVTAAVEDDLALGRDPMTRRIISALDSGLVDCLGHPSGRLLGQRPGYAVDLDAVMHAAQRAGVALELNCEPRRLDIDANHCRQARELDTPVAITSAAQHPEQLDRIAYGIYTARRGWLEADDVINCWSGDRLRAWRAEHRR